jgi:hypothetical protein
MPGPHELIYYANTGVSTIALSRKYSHFSKLAKEYGVYHPGIDRHGDNYTLQMEIQWEKLVNDYQGIIVPVFIPKQTAEQV